jgi:tRNA-dihydrouridine synthase A
LRYELAYQLKRDFPDLIISVNGGITTNAQITEHLNYADGVMVGRAAYHNPWLMTTWDSEFYGEALRPLTREGIEEAMVAYMERAFKEDGCPWYAIARHMLGLYHGQRGARLWRQVWSNHKLKPLPPQEVLFIAREALRLGAEVPVDTREVI